MNTKAICPNCGAEGTAGRFCEYCGTKIPMPKPKRRNKNATDSDEVKRIFEFQTSEEDAVKRMLHKLTEQENLPTDFFQNCNVDEVKPYYVPVYYYQVSFRAPWSCVKLVTREYEVYNQSTGRNEKRKTTERYPMNGVAMDSFCYTVCAGKEENVPEELYWFINDGMITDDTPYYDKSDKRELTDDELSILVEKGEASPNVLWKQHCEDFLEKKVALAVHSQLPSSYEDLSYSYTYNNPCQDLILPFWVVRYSYKGEKFVFVTDGLTKFAGILSPIDEKQASKSESIRKNLKLKSRKSGWSIFYFIIFSLATLITTILLFSTSDMDVTSWCLPLSVFFIFLTFIYGAKTTKRLKEKKKAQAVQTKFLNEAWLQRKKQLSSTLVHNGFGMTESKVNELLSTIKQEIENKDMSVDSNANCLWVKIITGIVLIVVLIVWGFGMIKAVGDIQDYIELKKEAEKIALEQAEQERLAERAAFEKAEQERKAAEAKQYEEKEFLKRIEEVATTDLQKLALPFGIKEIIAVTSKDSTAYYFNTQGYLTDIDAYDGDKTISYKFENEKLVSSEERGNNSNDIEYATYEEEIRESYSDESRYYVDLYLCKDNEKMKITTLTYDRKGRMIQSAGLALFEYDNKNRAKEFTMEALERKYICFVLPVSMYTPYPLCTPLDMNGVDVIRRNGKISQITFNVPNERIVCYFKY